LSRDWFDYIGFYRDTSWFPADDFRKIGESQFQALNVFCEMANQTIFNSLTQLYSNQYVSATVTSSDLFKYHTQTIIHQFINLTKTNFLLTLNMIRSTTQANVLYSGKQTNYDLLLRYYKPVTNKNTQIEVNPRWYDNCSCDYTITCAYETPMYRFENQPATFRVPGFYTGCYIIEAVLQSTLECFYNQTCITEIQSYFHISPVNVTALDPSLSMKYSYNSTIQQLLDGLMVEEWNTPITYENYYNQCHPIQCTYTYERKNRAIYILTVLLGLMGGLITILKLIVPILIKLITRKKRPRALEHGKMFITILLCYA
jgi:hypothetical protein